MQVDANSIDSNVASHVLRTALAPHACVYILLVLYVRHDKNLGGKAGK